MADDSDSVPLTGRAKSLANLRPWKPGQSGNPKGPPSYKMEFDRELARASHERRAEIVKRLIDDALAGDQQQMRTLISKLVPNVEKHEFAEGQAPSRMVIEFDKGGSGGEGKD